MNRRTAPSSTIERPAEQVAPDPRAIRVLCVDDHAVLVEGLKAQFAIDGGLDVVGRLATAARLVEEVERLRPGAVLLFGDIARPIRHGVDTIIGATGFSVFSEEDFQAFLERPDPPGQSGVDTLVLISASSKDYEFKRLLDLLGRLIAQRAGERDPAASFSIRKEVRPEIGAVYRVVHRGRPKTLVLLANGFVVNFFARYEKGVKTEYIDPIVSLQMLGLVRLLRHDVPPGLHPISEYLERADIARYWQGIEAACRPLAISG